MVSELEHAGATILTADCGRTLLSTPNVIDRRVSLALITLPDATVALLAVVTVP